MEKVVRKSNIKQEDKYICIYYLVEENMEDTREGREKSLTCSAKVSNQIVQFRILRMWKYTGFEG